MRRFIALVLLAACAAPTEEAPPSTNTASCSEDAPCRLESGVAQRGAISVRGEADHFTLAVAGTARPIVRLQLSADAPVTPVRYVATLLSPQGTVVGTVGPSPSGKPQNLDASFLVGGTGEYRLLVRDANGQGRDERNGYTLTATELADPDTTEPDDEQPPLASAPQGWVSFFGDRDLRSFDSSGEILALRLQQPAGDGNLRLRARVLRRSDSTPDDLASAVPVAEVVQPRAGVDAALDLARYFDAGRYVLEVSDADGTQAESTMAWTAVLERVADPDAGETAQRNDTPETATTLPTSGTVVGVVGSEGDRDWYAIDLPATTTPEIIEVRIDPGTSNNEVETLWAVGVLRATPSGTCNATCGPLAFCAGTQCAHDLRALRIYQRGDVRAQSVRIPHLGPARRVHVLVADQGDDARTTHGYTLTTALFADPDAPEPDDQRSVARPVEASDDGTGTLRFSGTGAISWWEYVDGRSTADQPADGDWFELRIPPPPVAPTCVGDGTDVGPCNPVDGDPENPVRLSRAVYGLSLRWQGPSDGAYRLGLQGVVPLDATRTACRFSFDDRIAHRTGSEWSVGNAPTDPCFCLPPTEADRGRVWLKVEAAHRTDPPETNRYSDAPYAWELTLSPDALQTTCQQQCAALASPSRCPGE